MLARPVSAPVLSGDTANEEDNLLRWPTSMNCNRFGGCSPGPSEETNEELTARFERDAIPPCWTVYGGALRMTQSGRRRGLARRW